ncbi:MAG: recombination protein RecN [Mycobacterium sp.]|nr:recombination protein RecN [Mycobacterium sp.]
MLSEIRIEALGAINAATAEFDRGLTVLTGETGTGKTMVVTGLHLLGGARADANRVRSGSDRAVVEGRFSTDDLTPDVAARIDEVLDASGAVRDDDGSVIAARSVSRDGPSRAYLGGRSVPAKSLSTFTTELLALHGQNDQLRLMRPDEQLAALDRFVDVESALSRYRSARETWLTARRDLADRRQRAREMAQEADRLQFGLQEIDSVAPLPGEDEALVNDIRRLSELDAVRDAALVARTALSGPVDEPAAEGTSAADGVGQAKAALSATDDAALRTLGDRLTEAMAVIGDVATELGDFLSELPSDASTLETKLARQGELRALTRKYAADIDGVLAWAEDARRRVQQLDVSEEALATLAQRVTELEAAVVTAAVTITKARTKAAKALAKAVTAELAGLAMTGAGFSISVSPMPARADDSAPLTLPTGETVHAGHHGGGHHDGVRRSRRRRRRSGSRADRTAAGPARADPPGDRGDPPAAGGRVRRRPPDGRQHRRTGKVERGPQARRRRAGGRIGAHARGFGGVGQRARARPRTARGCTGARAAGRGPNRLSGIVTERRPMRVADVTKGNWSDGCFGAPPPQLEGWPTESPS